MNPPERTAQKVAKFLTTVHRTQGNPQHYDCAGGTFSYAKKGETLPQIPGKTDQETDLVALQTGFFQLFRVSQGTEEKPSRWLGIGGEAELTHQISTLLATLPETKQEQEWVGICAANAFRPTIPRRTRPSPDPQLEM